MSNYFFGGRLNSSSISCVLSDGDFINFKIQLVQSFKCAHRNKTCDTYIHKISAHTCMCGCEAHEHAAYRACMLDVI
jgi:hypothetical protein